MKTLHVLAGVLCVLILPVDEFAGTMESQVLGVAPPPAGTLRVERRQLCAVQTAPTPTLEVVEASVPSIASSYTAPSQDAALVADGATGRILYARNAQAKRHPASLTKMMTLYLLFDALHRGNVTLRTRLEVSRHAAAQSPSNLDLDVGDTISVETAIKAVVVHSANDVAVAIAETLGGTETRFAERMTAKSRELGMRDTFYNNATGLPDEQQITTASDTLVLARHLAHDFPQYFSYFAIPSLSFRGNIYDTHDNLIGRYDGANGIKTGYTESSGFNLVSSVVRDRSHIIGIVMGGRTARSRDLEMMGLLDDAFVQIALNPQPSIAAEAPRACLPSAIAARRIAA